MMSGGVMTPRSGMSGPCPGSGTGKDIFKRVLGEYQKPVLFFRVLDNCQLVHPVHERVTFLNDTLKLASDTRYQFVTCEQIAGIDRHLSGPEEIGLDPLFPEFDPFNETVLFQLLDDPGTFAAV